MDDDEERLVVLLGVGVGRLQVEEPVELEVRRVGQLHGDHLPGARGLTPAEMPTPPAAPRPQAPAPPPPPSRSATGASPSGRRPRTAYGRTSPSCRAG